MPCPYETKIKIPTLDDGGWPAAAGRGNPHSDFRLTRLAKLVSAFLTLLATASNWKSLPRSVFTPVSVCVLHMKLKRKHVVSPEMRAHEIRT